MLKLEVGMPLKKSLIYYHDMLISHGLYINFACVTHDIYYTKEKSFDGLTENQIKKSCVRLRDIDNLAMSNKVSNIEKIRIEEDKLVKQGYHKVFDTIKVDFQYKKQGMHSCVQLQDIKDIGLLVYYDNEDYYNYPQDIQRKMLLEELNSYGFEFKESDLGLDKLRTLYYGKKLFSKNQNG